MVGAPINNKDNYLLRIGGTSNFDFLVLSYCERIKNDASLEKFYVILNMDNLITLQKEFLMAAFLDPESTDEVYKIKSRVALRHFRLFQRGLCEKHFDLLSEHFADALRDCWLPQDVIGLCLNGFQQMRPMFEENGQEVKNNDMEFQDHQDRLTQSMRETVTIKLVEEYDRLCRSENHFLHGDVIKTKKPSFLSSLLQKKHQRA